MELARFSSLNDLATAMLSFNETVNRLVAADNRSRPWSPAVDIFETDNELIFRADAPDLNLAQIEVQVENGTLTLKGERSIRERRQYEGLSPDGGELRRFRTFFHFAGNGRRRQRTPITRRAC